MIDLEPDGGNLYRAHPMQVNSGQFWRCAHGTTGFASGLEWEGCMKCAVADPTAFARWHGAILAAQAEPVAPSEFCWLVELFHRGGNSMGRYHTGFTDLSHQSRSTVNPHEAKRYTKADAKATAAELNPHMVSCEWRAVEHGFHKAPAPAVEPAGVHFMLKLLDTLMAGRQDNGPSIQLRGLLENLGRGAQAPAVEPVAPFGWFYELVPADKHGPIWQGTPSKQITEQVAADEGKPVFALYASPLGPSSSESQGDPTALLGKEPPMAGTPKNKWEALGQFEQTLRAKEPKDKNG